MRPISRRFKEYKPIIYKGFKIKFQVTSYSVLVQATRGNNEFHSLKKYKAEALNDVKKQINKYLKQ